MIRACDRSGLSTSTNRSNGTSACPNAAKISLTRHRAANRLNDSPGTLDLWSATPTY